MAIHTYVGGQPYRTARGRAAPVAPVESTLDRVHSVVRGTPTPAAFLRCIKRELKIRCYKRATIKCYLGNLVRFLRWLGRAPHQVTRENVREFLEVLVDGNASPSTLSGCLTAIRTAFDKFCMRDVTLGLVTPRQRRSQPLVLSTAEVMRILDAAPRPEWKLLIGIMYATGLRVSEVARLKVGDIQFERQTIRVCRGKGNKDRLVMLPESYRDTLNWVTKDRKSSDYLFPSLDNRAGRHVSPRTIQRWVKTSARLAGVDRKVTPHSFRHAFATHLLENGTDIRVIQKLLGHQRLDTTTLYTHLARSAQAQVMSPIDRLLGGNAGQSSAIQGGANGGGPQNALTSSGNPKPASVGRIRVHLQSPKAAETKVTLELLDDRRGSRQFLTGLILRRTEKNWFALELPDVRDWERPLSQLSAQVRTRIAEPEFFETVRSAVIRRYLVSQRE